MSFQIPYDKDEEPKQKRLQRRCEAKIDDLAADWSHLGPLERGERVVDILAYGLSNRKLAAILGCSEGLVRHYDIIGRLPDYWKQALQEGRYSAREVVARARRVWKEEANKRDQTLNSEADLSVSELLSEIRLREP